MLGGIFELVESIVQISGGDYVTVGEVFKAILEFVG